MQDHKHIYPNKANATTETMSESRSSSPVNGLEGHPSQAAASLTEFKLFKDLPTGKI